MPARSQQQREWAFGVMGEKWARRHHFDNPGKLPHKVHKDGIPTWANYRPGEFSAVTCGTCDFIRNGLCTMFENTPVDSGYVCDAWSGKVDKQEGGDGAPSVAPMYTTTPPKEMDQTWEGLQDMFAAVEPDPTQLMAKAGVSAAGIAVRAADTGRVLMIQRKRGANDPAAGCWEFPGGCLEGGEHPYLGAKREWQEEMGVRLPKGRHVGSWQSGIYQGFVHEVPSETAVRLNSQDGRYIGNPDDPDGDGVEVAAWWEPEHMKRSRAVRQELHDARAWNKVQKQRGTLYLISHAKTRYNRPGQPHDIIQSWRDIPIDATGKRQARQLGRFMKRVGVEEIHTSDLKRASQTSDIAGRIAGIPVKPDRKFRPWNLGSFAGHSSADVIPKLKPYMTSKTNEKVDGGESFNEYMKRFIPALEDLLMEVDEGKILALVSHSRNVELAQGWVEGKGPRSKIDTAAIEADVIPPAAVYEVTEKRKGHMKVEECSPSEINKGQAHPAVLHLRVNGVSRSPDGGTVYRMVTRDGHYVGRTNSTRYRARKGDVVKIQANDFQRDAWGDYHWANPNIVSGYNDSAHSWKELEALAGGSLTKDFAQGAEAPPAGDTPTGTSAMPSAGTLAAMQPAAQDAVASSGPTLEDVHRNRPLKNLSVAYMNRKVKIRVHKADRHKQLVYGVVLEPNILDSQDDYMLPDQVERAAHGYMKKVARGKASVSKLQHATQGFFRNKPGVVPVESYIAPVDFTMDGIEMVKKGTWVMCCHVEDPEIWNDVLKGEYTGFSIGGTGIRRSMHVPPELVPSGMISGSQPADWYRPGGRLQTSKAATSADFEAWRDWGWEGA